jgi:translocation and assembly module TamB
MRAIPASVTSIRSRLTRYGRPLLRTLIIIALVLLITAWLATGALVLVLRNDDATHWAVQTAQRLVPELTLAGPRGNLIDGLHIDTLRLDLPDLELVIEPIDLRLSWANLLRARATLDPLRIGRITIHPHGPGNDDPVVLPTLAAPIRLHVPQLNIGELVIRSGEGDDQVVTTLSGIAGSLRWLGTDLQLADVKLAYEGLGLAASTGHLRFAGQWPLALNGVINGNALPGPAIVKAGGTLHAIDLDAQLGGDWPLHAQAVLRVLDSNVPFTLAAQLARPVTQDLGAAVVTFQRAELKAAGDIEQFTGTLHSKLHDSRYGDSTLQSALSWTNAVLAAKSTLALIENNQSHDTVTSECQLDTTASQWSCRGDIAALPLTPWLNGLTGDVSTPFTVAGRLADAIDLQIELAQIRGTLHTPSGEVALTGAARAQSPDLQRWSIPALNLAVGPNRLGASGELGAGSAVKNSQLRVQIEAPQLAQLYAGLSGAARGQVDITGQLDAPTLRGDLQLRDVHFQDVQLQSGTGRFAVDDLGRRASDITLSLQGLVISGQRTAVDARWQGTRASHDWRLNLLHASAQAELGCHGALTDNEQRYRLDCATVGGSIALNDRRTVNLAIDKPLRATWDLTRNEGGVDAFCLRGGTASLCVKPGLQVRQNQLQAFDATLAKLPLRWWQRELPEGLRLRNDPHLDAELHFVKQQPLQLQARATVEASEWRWRGGDQAETLALDAVVATADLDAKRAHLATAIHAPTLGSARAELTVFDPTNTRRLQGRVDLEAIQLAALAWAIPDVEKVSGHIDGGVAIAGSAAQPLISGQFALVDGFVDIAGVNDPIEKLRADLRFDNLRADLEGTFQIGGGGAQLLGDMTWDAGYQNWRAEMHLRGDHLQVEPIVGSTVVFGPDLTLTAVPGDLQLRGEMLVERADIQLKQLPPQTVNPSRDTVVSGREATGTGLPLTLDIALNLGKDIHFIGFGAEVDLAGQLHLQQEKNRELVATGRVNVTKGRYRAYGQRLLVRKGQFIFIGNLDNPDLNLEAIREMTPGNTDVVGLRVTGSLRDPVAQLFSEQSLSESDTAYYLLTGRKRDTSQSGGGEFSAGGTLLSLGLSSGEDQAAKLAEKFGIRGLQLGTAAASDGSTEAEVSGYLFRDLYVRYGRSLGQNVDSVTLQYQLSPNLMIQTVSGIEEALDLIYTFTLD